MPETEDLTMHLADLFKIKTWQHALIPTSEGKLAYIAKRFDRENGQKIHAEDFCQCRKGRFSIFTRSLQARAGK